MTQDNRRRGTLPQVLAHTRYFVILGGLLGLLSGCSGTDRRGESPNSDADFSNIPDAVPKVEPKSQFGNPESYVVFGRRYRTMDSSDGYVARGVASWYGPTFHGRRTSSGEPYDMYAMTAAHKTLPLPTYARVTNLQNGRSAVVKVNDRGPFYADRVIDLSYAAASKLGVVKNGTAFVEIRAIDPAHPQSEENLFVSRGNDRSTSGFLSDDGPLTPAVAAAQPRSEEKEAPATGPARPAEVGKPDTASRAEPMIAEAKVKSGRRLETQPPRSEPKIAKAAPKANPKVARAAPKPEPKVAAVPRKPEPKIAAATKESVPSPVSSSGLYLQVGAFGERANAEQLRRRLVDHLAEHVLVRTSDGSKAPLYKVHIGPLDSRKKAATVSHQLAALGLTQSHVVLE
jgi:rare lipoprotein A